MGIDHGSAKGLFTVLDEDKSGKLSVEEFVNGFLKLKGAATARDMAFLMHESRKIKKKLAKLSQETKLLSALRTPRRVQTAIHQRDLRDGQMGCQQQRPMR